MTGGPVLGLWPPRRKSAFITDLRKVRVVSLGTTSHQSTEPLTVLWSPGPSLCVNVPWPAPTSAGEARVPPCCSLSRPRDPRASPPPRPAFPTPLIHHERVSRHVTRSVSSCDANYKISRETAVFSTSRFCFSTSVIGLTPINSRKTFSLVWIFFC